MLQLYQTPAHSRTELCACKAALLLVGH